MTIPPPTSLPAPGTGRGGDRRPRTAGWLRAVTGAQLAVDVALAGVLVLLAVAPIPWELTSPGPLVLVVAAASIAVRRLNPGVALTLGWATALLQFGSGERPSVVQLASLAVLYSAAADGRPAEVWASAVSAVVGGIAATPYLALTGFRYAVFFETGTFEQRVLIALLPLAFLGSAWLIGFAVRSTRARRTEVRRRSAAEVRATEAQETADVERVRSTMAREVHDVVGHSLAVIIAQADAAEVLDDPARVRAMVANIARTARTSLEEVRSVLDRTGVAPVPLNDETLSDVIGRVRSTGAPLTDREDGVPVDLAPPVALVARRVLQEMLTNALRHGAPGRPIAVERSWRPRALVLETVNEVSPADTGGSGNGLAGMRARLQGIGGTLEADTVGERFVVRARIPIDQEAPR